MLSPVLLGIDLGTSSLKAVLGDASGASLAVASRAYPILAPQPGWAEQDPHTWEQAAIHAVQEVLSRSGIEAERVAGIGITGQMHGLVCVDERGQPLRPAIIWPDQRSTSQVTLVNQVIGHARLFEWTANPVATGFQLVSWLWLREHEPEIAQAVRWLLLPKDYLRLRWSGDKASEPSDASATSFFNPIQNQWSQPLLEELHIDQALLPTIKPSADVAGTLSAETAQVLGLRPGIPLAFGASDQAAQALGNGIIHPGQASSTIGTGGQWFVALDRPAADPELRLHLFCHAVPQRWHFLAAILAAGLSLRWLRDNFLGSDFQSLADAAAKVAPGAEGLYFAPYLVGERTPHMDPRVRGAFVGLSQQHTRGHLTRAVMEGVIYAMREGLELIERVGGKVENIVASGGAAQHPLWLQLQADIYNRPIYQTETREAAASGAALLGGLAAGLYPDYETAIRETVHLKPEIIEPNPSDVRIYEAGYQSFRTLYPILKTLE